MNVQRDPDAIIADWLEDGPARLPDTTRRAIAVTTRTTRQSRRPLWVLWRFPNMNGASRFAVAAVAIVAVALGGLYLFNSTPGGGVGSAPSPSVSPSPSLTDTAGLSAAVVPVMDTLFTSPKYGYSVRHPSDWTPAPAKKMFNPGAPSENRAGVFLDAVAPPTGSGLLRAGSARIPAGEDAEAWTARHFTDCDSLCRSASEAIVIDGQPAFIAKKSLSEVEATVIVGDRVYQFTLFGGGDPGEPNVMPNLRATFDAMMATVDLRPKDAVAPPSPSGS